MDRFASIAEVARLLAHGTASAIEICDEMLGAITRFNPGLGPFSDILADSARAEAQESDLRRARGESRGPLDGVPIAIKDLIDTSPAKCSAGLKHLADYRPATDATVVRQLRHAGAVVLGVTETDPGAFSTDTLKTRNPLAPDRIAGGSSGGSAAAVAAGLAYAAIGTDTGGSIRIPAACCSIYGFKPTWGRVDTAGVRPLAASLDHVGPLARNVSDLRIVQDVLDPNGFAVRQEQALPAAFGIAPAYYADATDTVRTVMDDLVAALQAEEETVRGVALPDPDQVLAFHLVNLPKETAYHAELFPTEWNDYPAIARDTIALGLGVTSHAYDAAKRARSIARAEVDRALAGLDAIIVPTMPMDAPLRDTPEVILGDRSLTRLHATVRYTALFNQTGHPVVSMPIGLLPDGRAISAQIVGHRGEDARLLALAGRIERMLAISINYAGLNAEAAKAPANRH